MELSKCPECGQDVSKNDLSCSNCGYPIKNAKEETLVNLYPKCGKKQKMREMTCHNCGYDRKSQSTKPGNLKIIKIVSVCY